MNEKFKKVGDYIRKNRVIILSVYGIIMALCFVIPVFFVKESGGANWYKVKKLNEAFNDFVEMGEFDYAHIAHSEGWIYFPYIMKWFGLDADRLFMAVQSSLGIVALSIYPLMIYEIYKSYLLSVISPFLFNFTIGDMLYRQGNEEFYAIMWAAVVTFPFLILLLNEKRKTFIFAFTIIIAMFVAVSNCLRFHSGLPVVCIMLLIMIFKMVREKGNRIVIIVSIVCVFALYNSLSAFLPETIGRRWSFMGGNEYNSSPWHSILIGLGCYDNKYGLEYDDNCAMNMVKERWPEIEYQSDQYYYKCKVLFFELLKNDPQFVITTELRKFLGCMREEVDYVIGNKILLLLFLGSVMTLVLRGRRFFVSYWHVLSIGILFCVISTYGGIAAIPKASMYTYSSVGCTSLLVFFLTITVMKIVMKKNIF